MELIIPKLQHHVTGVYKIVIDNKWVYIGSSNNLRRRFIYWRYKILNNDFKKQKDIGVIVSQANQVVFSVIHVVNGIDYVRFLETVEIFAEHKNPFILNKLNLPKTKTKQIVSNNVQPICVYDKTGQIQHVYNSIADADKVYGRNAIANFFNGKTLSAKGHIFKKIDTNGNIVDFVIRDRLKGTRPEMKHKRGKKVLKYDKQGNFIKEYLCVADAVKETGKSKLCVLRVLKGTRSHHNGFVYRYA